MKPLYFLLLFYLKNGYIHLKRVQICYCISTSPTVIQNATTAHSTVMLTNLIHAKTI